MPGEMPSFNNKEKKEGIKYFAVWAKVNKEPKITLPQGEVFIAKNQEQAEKMMKQEIEKKIMGTSIKIEDIEIWSKEISRGEYNQEIVNKKIREEYRDR